MFRVYAKKGVFYACILALYIFTFAFFAGLVVYSFAGHTGLPPSIPGRIILGTVALYAFYSAITTAFITVKISTTEMVTQTLIGTRRTSFSGIQEVKILPTYGTTFFRGFNIAGIKDTSKTRGSHIALQASVYANRHELVKAIIEAAFLANPNVQIDRHLLDYYGQPPYGIFKSKE